VTVVAAHTSLSLGGMTVNRSTNNSAGNSGPATKTWADARINITQTGTNPVGEAHTFNVTTEANNGTSWASATGTITATSLTGVGAITGGTCTVGASTPCTIIVNSSAPGSATVHAAANVVVGGLTIAVATDGYGANTVSNVKTWIEATVPTPSATSRPGSMPGSRSARLRPTR
jgi:hypothetical protein